MKWCLLIAVLMLGAVVVFVPSFIPKARQEAAHSRIYDSVLSLERGQPAMNIGYFRSGNKELISHAQRKITSPEGMAKLAGDLHAIETSGAPRETARALTEYASALQTAADVWRQALDGKLGEISNAKSKQIRAFEDLKETRNRFYNHMAQFWVFRDSEKKYRARTPKAETLNTNRDLSEFTGRAIWALPK